MKCPVGGSGDWHTVVRKENPNPTSQAFVMALYHLCTK